MPYLPREGGGLLGQRQAVAGRRGWEIPEPRVAPSGRERAEADSAQPTKVAVAAVERSSPPRQGKPDTYAQRSVLCISQRLRPAGPLRTASGLVHTPAPKGSRTPAQAGSCAYARAQGQPDPCASRVLCISPKRSAERKASLPGRQSTHVLRSERSAFRDWRSVA